MQIFYAPDIKGDSYTLDENESRHSIRVLRMKKGTLVRLIDGKGNFYVGMITEPDPRNCLVKIISVVPDFEKRKYKLHIAISLIKNPDRFEWFVEKSVEIGVDEITPLICKNTEKTGIKPERIRNLIISSMKQSLKAHETLLNETVTFDNFINQFYKGKLMIAHCNSNLKRSKIRQVYPKGNNAVILIGPEGDFSVSEIEAASANGFVPVHLGQSRLRTETAGIAACHSVYFINQ
jgi:16S rRNA (uracil1498-N3)-methyltransferase